MAEIDYGHLVFVRGTTPAGKKSGLYLVFEKYAQAEERWVLQDFASATGARSLCLMYCADAVGAVHELATREPDRLGLLPPEVNTHWWAYSLNGQTHSISISDLLERVRNSQPMEWICAQAKNPPAWANAELFRERVNNFLARISKRNITHETQRLAGG